MANSNGKVTIATKYDEIAKALVSANIVFEDGQSALDFIADRKAKATRKSVSAKTAENKLADMGICEEILGVLTNNGMRVGEIVAALNNKYSSSKVTYLLTKIISEDNPRAVKVVDKKISKYSLA